MTLFVCLFAAHLRLKTVQILLNFVTKIDSKYLGNSYMLRFLLCLNLKVRKNEGKVRRATDMLINKKVKLGFYLFNLNGLLV